MITDIGTIMWKEGKELLFQRPNLRGGWLGLFFFLGVFGVFLPLQSGPAWVKTPLVLVYWSWVPFFMVSSVVADAFAGERERHTLETLLSSRLSDKAILFGKIATAVGYAWGLTMISILIGLIAINIAFPGEGLLVYPLELAFGIVGMSFLIAALSAEIGVLISLRSPSVRSAQQTLGMITLLPMLLVFVVQMLPGEWLNRAAGVFNNAQVSTILFYVMSVLVIVNLILLRIVGQRFQRTKMILD